MITLSLSIDPVPKQRPRLRRFGGTYTPARTVVYENSLKLLIGQKYTEPPLSGPLCVCLKFFLEKPKRPSCQAAGTRPDLDNYIKAVLDACNDVLWFDDGQIVRLESAKLYSPIPRVILCVQTIEEWKEKPISINLNPLEI